MREAFVERGMVADIAVHGKTASDGMPNAHVHLMLSTRSIDPATGGFGRKERSWNAKTMLTGWRQEWEHACNAALKRAQVRERVSRERLEVQLQRALEAGDFATAARVDRLPGVHLGPSAWEMQARGVETDLGHELRAIQEHDAAVAAAYEHARELGGPAQAALPECRREVRDPLEAVERWAELAMERIAEWLEQAQELAMATVERVQEVALSAWDRLVQAMSPMSDFAAAEREHEPNFADRFREALLERSEHNRERAVGREPPGLELGL